MSKVRIFADSFSDLPQDWIEKYNIEMVRVYIVFQGLSIRDGIDINLKQMCEMIDLYGELPNTSAPSKVDFVNAFSPVIENGEDVLYISMSSHLSSTYQNALLAAREFPSGRVTVVDSLNVSAGIAMNVLLGAQMAREGNSALRIAEHLQKCRDEIQLNVLVKNLDYLHKSRIVGHIQCTIEKMLRIRPILYMDQGRVAFGEKYRGNKTETFKKLLQKILTNIHRIDHDLIIIAHSNEEEKAEELRKTILEETNIREVLIIKGGCSTFSHSGPNSVAISFILKSEPSVKGLMHTSF